jgi:hypothetical protein
VLDRTIDATETAAEKSAGGKARALLGLTHSFFTSCATYATRAFAVAQSLRVGAAKLVHHTSRLLPDSVSDVVHRAWQVLSNILRVGWQSDPPHRLH